MLANREDISEDILYTLGQAYLTQVNEGIL